MKQFLILILLFTFLGCEKKSTSQKNQESLLLQKGIQKYEQGDYDSAIRYYQKTLQINPKNEKALIDLGILYEDHKKDIPKAMESYQHFLLLHPNGDKAEMVKGWLLRLAVSHPKNVEIQGSIESGVQTSVRNAFQEENRLLKKEIQELQNQLNTLLVSEEALHKSLDQQAVKYEKQLQVSQDKIVSLEKKVEKSEKEAKPVDPQLDSLVKQEMIKFQEEKIELTKEYDNKIKELQDQNQALSQEKKVLLAQLAQLQNRSGEEQNALAKQIEQLLQEKKKLEIDLAKSQNEGMQLKEAYQKIYQEQAALEKNLSEKEEQIANLKGQVAKLAQKRTLTDADRSAYNRQIGLLKKRISFLENSPKEVPSTKTTTTTSKREYELVTYHRVRRGETLMMIAGYQHIYGDRKKWKLIYDANKDNIDDPNVLVPGQILLVPR